MRCPFTAVLALVGLVAACDEAGDVGLDVDNGRTLTVFTAASLTEAFTRLGAAFEQANPGVEMIFNFAGSQLLATQIELGAPADVYASADREQMARLRQAGLVEKPVDFATNRPVIIVPAGNPASIQRPADLGRRGIRLVLGAPAVPIGGYARRALAELGVLDAALANLVSNEEDVKQVVGKVMLGEADAGIVYESDITAEVADELETIELRATGVIARYPISVTADSRDSVLAQSFVEFVLNDGESILRQSGFGPP